MRLSVLLLIFLLLPLAGFAAAPKTALFAGGCFWCMESELEGVDGVASVVSGFAGGHVENPSYQQVSRGDTGHREVVQVTYDPDKISYMRLLKIYWGNVDPFDSEGQFCDKGEQYRAAIFVNDEEERALAEESKAAVAKRFGREVMTDILPAARFYPAEEYHQDYYLKSAGRYKSYREGCGRDARLKELGESR